MTGRSGDALLFASARIRVRHARRSGNVCFVNFDAYVGNADPDRDGFGEAFLAARGFDAVHVLPAGNHWYHYPEMDAALATVAAVAAGYERVVAYGSSMGGYAALVHGAAAGAHAALALSPQFSLDRSVVPLEDRWRREAAAIAFRSGPYPPTGERYVAYDSRDRREVAHVARHAEVAPLERLEIPHGGHPAGGILNEMGLLAPLVEGVARGPIALAWFAAAVRAGRKLTAHHAYTLSVRAGPRRPELAVALARRALAADPDHPGFMTLLAHQLDRIGHHAEAGPLHERAVAAGGGLDSRHKLLWHLERAGKMRDAWTLARRLARQFPDDAVLRRAVVRLSWRAWMPWAGWQGGRAAGRRG